MILFIELFSKVKHFGYLVFHEGILLLKWNEKYKKVLNIVFFIRCILLWIYVMLFTSYTLFFKMHLKSLHPLIPSPLPLSLSLSLWLFEVLQI